jgi:hypothetical protein
MESQRGGTYFSGVPLPVVAAASSWEAHLLDDVRASALEMGSLTTLP